MFPPGPTSTLCYDDTGGKPGSPRFFRGSRPHATPRERLQLLPAPHTRGGRHVPGQPRAPRGRAAGQRLCRGRQDTAPRPPHGPGELHIPGDTPGDTPAPPPGLPAAHRPRRPPSSSAGPRQARRHGNTQSGRAGRPSSPGACGAAFTRRAGRLRSFPLASTRRHRALIGRGRRDLTERGAGIASSRPLVATATAERRRTRNRESAPRGAGDRAGRLPEAAPRRSAVSRCPREAGAQARGLSRGTGGGTGRGNGEARPERPAWGAGRPRGPARLRRGPPPHRLSHISQAKISSLFPCPSLGTAEQELLPLLQPRSPLLLPLQNHPRHFA